MKTTQTPHTIGDAIAQRLDRVARMEGDDMRRAIPALVMTVLLLTGGAGAQQKKQQDIDLQAAIRTETVDGDLNGAIKQYSAIVSKYTADRAITATALVHMAECYHKMGDAESRKIYERVAREFADQKEAAAEARARLGDIAPALSAGIITRQVWTGPKADIYGTVSPDGRYLSGTDWYTGELVLHDVSSGKDRRLTNKGTWADSTEYAEESVIAPDGKQVAYSWYNANRKGFRYDLRVISLNASGPATPRVLYDNEDIEWIGPDDWSSDGKWIAVQIQRKDRTAQIGLVATGDGSLRVLKSVDWRGSTKMFFSPDSQYVAFDLPSSQGSDERDVFVLAINGSREIPAVIHPAYDVVMGWTPDGRHLLFNSDRTGALGVWALAFREGKPQGTPVLVKPNIGRALAMGLTRSGALYFGVRTDGPDVHIASVDFNSGKVLIPPARATQHFIGSNGHPDWSHDGRYLAYTSRRDPVVVRDRSSIVAIRSMETGEVREIHPKLIGTINSLRWAPDGRSLAVQGTDAKARQGIYRVDVQTGEVSLIMQDTGGAAVPEWAPDGKKLFYARRGRIVELDLASGKEREVVRTENPCRISLSPDGRYLACQTFGDEPIKNRTLVAIPAEGGEPRELIRLHEPESFGGFTAWTPDSRSVLFWKVLSALEYKSEYWLVPLAGGQSRKVDLGIEGAYAVRIHPDGTRVAFTAGENKSEVWVMENFLSALSATK
jgi:Tol biopolymer transport system component